MFELPRREFLFGLGSSLGAVALTDLRDGKILGLDSNLSNLLLLGHGQSSSR